MAFMSDMKADLHLYLKTARESLLWKLDGLSEYDVRRPMTPTGTNLLGLVKHVASVEAGYFGYTFGRPFLGKAFEEALPWYASGKDPNDDLWATADESREFILDLYDKAIAHSDATIEELPLDALGRVPWWPAERGEVTLHRIMAHVVAETHRHAGHADIVRELIDGRVGLREENTNIAPHDEAWWQAYRDKLEQVAKEAR
jgi:uncharacterized damage-inducible protein DinB